MGVNTEINYGGSTPPVVEKAYRYEINCYPDAVTYAQAYRELTDWATANGCTVEVENDCKILLIPENEYLRTNLTDLPYLKHWSKTICARIEKVTHTTKHGKYTETIIKPIIKPIIEYVDTATCPF